MLVNGVSYYVQTYERHKLCGLIGRLIGSTGGKDCGRGKGMGMNLHGLFLQVDVPGSTHFFFPVGNVFLEF